MKIGILTASRTNNIGTDLQALAMQWLFSSCGNHSVELINYKSPKLENSRKILSKKSLKGYLSIPYNLARKINHGLFRNKYFNHSKQVYDISNLENINYDLVVVGSDQLWNWRITGDDKGFYLPFRMNGIKASYAVSISKYSIATLEGKPLDPLSLRLQGFKYVSVREKESFYELKNFVNKTRYDLDPLLMIESEQWERLSIGYKKRRGYVLLYVVDRIPEAVQFAIDYAKKHDLDVYMWANVIKPIKGVKPIRFKGIRQWLSYVKNASLFVTNSYHGLSFAINFQKDFAIFNLLDKDSNDRLENLLNVLSIPIQTDGSVYKPNWNNVELQLSALRLNSQDYVDCLISEAENYVIQNKTSH